MVLCTRWSKPGKTPHNNHWGVNGNNYLGIKKQTEDKSREETAYEHCKNLHQSVKM